jgi:hypothetical protein
MTCWPPIIETAKATTAAIAVAAKQKTVHWKVPPQGLDRTSWAELRHGIARLRISGAMAPRHQWRSQASTAIGNTPLLLAAGR